MGSHYPGAAAAPAASAPAVAAAPAAASGAAAAVAALTAAAFAAAVAPAAAALGHHLRLRAWGLPLVGEVRPPADRLCSSNTNNLVLGCG